MIIGCYFDESYAQRRAAIAAYLAPLTIWDDKFTPTWRRFLASAPHPISEYKTDDIRYRGNEFECWTKEEARTFALRAVQLLGDVSAFPHLYGFGVAMTLPHASEKDIHEWEKHGLVSCFRLLLLNAIAFLRKWEPPITCLQCVSDIQPRGLTGLFQEAFGDAKELVAPDCNFRISNLQFEDSREVLPIQTADMLAYETRKELASRLESPQRYRSRALIHLLQRRVHVGFYLDQKMFEETGLPPILYESSDAREALPWIGEGRALDPPPLFLPSY